MVLWSRDLSSSAKLLVLVSLCRGLAIHRLLHLPQYHPSTLRSHREYPGSILLSSERYAVYPFWERNTCFLVVAFPAIDMHDSFVGLGRKDVRSADSYAIGLRGAFLESGLQSWEWLEVVDVYTECRDVSRFLWNQRRGNEAFCEHYEHFLPIDGDVKMSLSCLEKCFRFQAI